MTHRSLDPLRTEARAAKVRGDIDRARLTLEEALSCTEAREDEYLGVLGELRELHVVQGDFRKALTLEWYAGNERTQRPLLDCVSAADRARTLVAWAEAPHTHPGRAHSLYALAGDAYESAGMIAHAAIAREDSDDFRSARALWTRLAETLISSRTDPYAAGLTRFNIARAASRSGDIACARREVVAAVQLLEEAADRFETIGQRERGFDCFQVLIAIGRETQELEHVLEGYVNVVRILREDHLQAYALQSYEEAVSTFEQNGELAAAATLAREMSRYARTEGLAAVANHATLTEARLWYEAARASQNQQGAAQSAESALLARVAALSQVGRFREVGVTFAELSKLPIAQARAKVYSRAKARYDDATDEAIAAAPLPPHLRHEVVFQDVCARQPRRVGAAWQREPRMRRDSPLVKGMVGGDAPPGDVRPTCGHRCRAAARTRGTRAHRATCEAARGVPLGGRALHGPLPARASLSSTGRVGARRSRHGPLGGSRTNERSSRCARPSTIQPGTSRTRPHEPSRACTSPTPSTPLPASTENGHHRRSALLPSGPSPR